MIVAPRRARQNFEQILLLNSEDRTPDEPWIIRSAPPTIDFKLEDVMDFKDICRICAAKVRPIVPIFEGYGKDSKLAEKINNYLPIFVTPQDTLPLGVCAHCMHMVVAWHELVRCTAQADEALRQRQVRIAAIRQEEQNPPEPDDPSDVYEAQLSVIVRHKILSCLKSLDLNEQESDLQFVCQKCPEHPQCSDVDRLAQHMEKTHNSDIQNHSTIEEFIKNCVTFEERLISDDCDSATPESPELEVKVIKDLKDYHCPFCESIFTTPTRLMYHLSQHVDLDIEQGVSCCEQLFNIKSSFVKHLQDCHVERQTADEIFNTCRACGYRTDTAKQLQAHVVAQHSGVSELGASKKIKPSANNQKYIPVRCPECRKLFSNKYHMKEHLMSQCGTSGAKRFACDRCGRRYRWAKSLQRHRRLAHQGLLPHVCPHCGERFPTGDASRAHCRIAHSGEKPFRCRYCDKTFHRKYILDRHIDMHLDVRKYPCDRCSKAFRKGSHLTRHRARCSGVDQ